MLGLIGWSFLGLCGAASLGVALHTALHRLGGDGAPPVWRSPTLGSDLAYGLGANACFAVALAAALRWTSRGASPAALISWTLALLLVHDTYFYWCHRLLHLPWMFRNVHAVHHRSVVPTPLSAMAMHPLEAVLEAIFVPAVAAAVHPPTASLLVFFAAMIGLNTLGHLGLAGVPLLNGRPGALRLLSQTDTHLGHHQTPDRSFGAYLTWWDIWRGT